MDRWRLRNTADRWGAAAVAMHWLSVPLLVFALGVGWWAEHQADGESRILLYEAHYSAGLVILLLTLARLAWRMVDPRPRPPHDLDRLQRWAAHSVHALLYLAVLAIILSGLVNFLFIGPVRIFGLVHVPRLFDPETQEPLRTLSWYVHIYGYLSLLPLLGAHVGAALLHHFARRDQLLRSFWFPPGR